MRAEMMKDANLAHSDSDRKLVAEMQDILTKHAADLISDKAAHMKKMQEARRAKLDALKGAKAGKKPNWSGRKPSGANKQFPNGRPARSKDQTILELKALIHSGTKDAICQIWRIMHFSKSETLRLEASKWWVERDLGKVASMEGANIGAITFNVVTGVPSPDDDDVIEMASPRPPRDIEIRWRFLPCRFNGVS